MERWHWQGGRLVRGNKSLTTIQAWLNIPFDAEIAEACKDVLNPCPEDKVARQKILYEERSVISRLSAIDGDWIYRFYQKLRKRMAAK